MSRKNCTAFCGVFYRNGKGQLALRILARRWRDNPIEFKGVRARMGTLLGDVYLKLRMNEEARQIFSTLVNLWPEDKLSDYWRKRLAKAYSRLGDWMGASDHFMTLWKRHQEDDNGAEYLFYFAWQRGMAGEFRLARSALDQYLEYDKLKTSKIRTALWFKAWFAYRAGLYETALAELQALTTEYPKRNPYEAPAAYWKARILEKLGRVSDAMRAYKKVSQSSSLASYYPLLAWQRLKELAPTLDETPKPPRWLPPKDAPLPPPQRGPVSGDVSARPPAVANIKASPTYWGKKARSLSNTCAVYEPLQRGMLLASLGISSEARFENQVFFRTLRNHTHRGRVRLPNGCTAPGPCLVPTAGFTTTLSLPVPTPMPTGWHSSITSATKSPTATTPAYSGCIPRILPRKSAKPPWPSTRRPRWWPRSC